MKTIKKIFWFVILVSILYVILIFVKPTFADSLAKILGIEDFNKKVRVIKNGLDFVSTKIPTKQELESAYSGAKEKIGDIKENINDIRNKTKDIEKKYDETKKFINDTSKKIDSLKKNLNDLQEVGKNITNIINTGAIN